MDDETRLRQFCAEVQRLVSRRAIREGTIAASWKVNIDTAAGTTIESNLGDEEDARSLIIDVRRLVLNDPTSFGRVTNTIERAVTDEELRDANRVNRAQWRKASEVGTAGLVMNGVTYTPRTMFDLYAYGGVFHAGDADKVALWDSLDEMTRTLVLAEVNSYVFRCSTIAHTTRNLIEEGFKRGAFTFDDTP